MRRLFFAVVYFVGAIVLLVDAADSLADALGELFFAAVVTPANTTEGTPDNAD